MIMELRIKNVALIDEAEVSFGAGLNVLTGETGAGKSIVVDSINFMLGERTARDFLRSGAESASVEGLVELDDDSYAAVTGLGFDLSGDRQLLIRRVLNAQGKSVCRINGRTVTVGMLKDVSSLLVDVHGQHEHQSLLNNEWQLHMLDQFCGESLVAYKKSLAQFLQQYRENGRAIKALSGFGGEREAQLEILQFQINEIEKAKLKPDEENELQARQIRLSGLDKLSRATTEALKLLTGDESVSASDLLGNAMTLVQEIARLDPARASLAVNVEEAVTAVSDAVRELSAYRDELDADPQELEQVETRLDTIYRLKKKYGPTLADVLKHYNGLVQRNEAVINSEADLKRLNAKRRELSGEITRLCRAMSGLRKQQAVTIQTQITGVLTELGMNHARFEIKIESKKEFGPEGNDRAEFMISPNPGEGMKPLSRIASGGEMSRVMLAIKTVLADADRIGTLIFDEVDAGVSGRTAQQVAEKLKLIARNRQILCITHLPQIAAMADIHFLIEKKTDGDKTVTSVRAQSRDEMIQELARLIGGAKITDATIKAAGEMKQLAETLSSP